MIRCKITDKFKWLRRDSNILFSRWYCQEGTKDLSFQNIVLVIIYSPYFLHYLHYSIRDDIVSLNLLKLILTWNWPEFHLKVRDTSVEAHLSVYLTLLFNIKSIFQTSYCSVVCDYCSSGTFSSASFEFRMSVSFASDFPTVFFNSYFVPNIKSGQKRWVVMHSLNSLVWEHLIFINHPELWLFCIFADLCYLIGETIAIIECKKTAWSSS